MTHRIIVLLVLAGFGSGCATIDKPDRQPVPAITTDSTSLSGRPFATEAAKPKFHHNPMRSSQELPPNAIIPSDEPPFAIIKVDPKIGKLTGEMELRLQQVVEEAKRDERTLLRIESFVPAGGSPGFDLGNSERILHIVKDRLVGSGISQRRILVSNFGAEYDLQRDPSRHWVEIHLVRMGTTSTPTSIGTGR